MSTLQDKIAAGSSILLRLGAFFFLRWIPGHVRSSSDTQLRAMVYSNSSIALSARHLHAIRNLYTLLHRQLPHATAIQYSRR
jgi:hypothetical protein